MSKIYILIHLVQSNQTVKLLPRGLYQKQLSKLAFWQVQPSQIGSQENGQPKQYLGPPGWEFGTLAILDRTTVETIAIRPDISQILPCMKTLTRFVEMLSLPPPLTYMYCCLERLRIHHRFFGGRGGEAKQHC